MAILLPAVLTMTLASLPHGLYRVAPPNPIHDSIVHIASTVPLERRGVAARTASRAQTSKGTKIAAAVVGAVGGFFGGAALGYAVDRGCGCDDAGLKGMAVGGPIGAIAGAVFGTWLVSR